MIYLAIRQAGVKYVVHPTSEHAYQASVDNNEAGVWYYTSEKDINAFATANVFGSYDSQPAAENAILAVDPNVSKIYRPPVSPSA
jgi:type II secretory pathway component PulC